MGQDPDGTGAAPLKSIEQRLSKSPCLQRIKRLFLRGWENVQDRNSVEIEFKKYWRVLKMLLAAQCLLNFCHRLGERELVPLLCPS